VGTQTEPNAERQRDEILLLIHADDDGFLHSIGIDAAACEHDGANIRAAILAHYRNST